MKRAEVQRAVDDEFAAGIRKLFVVLETGCGSSSGDVNLLAANFRDGIVSHKTAREIASEIVAQLFEE